jgi:hypothetical protein
MLGDDGGPAVVVLSDDGKTKQSKTALSILDEFIEAIKGAEGKVVLSDQASLVPGERHQAACDPGGREEAPRERIAEAKAALTGVDGARKEEPDALGSSDRVGSVRPSRSPRSCRTRWRPTSSTPASSTPPVSRRMPLARTSGRRYLLAGTILSKRGDNTYERYVSGAGQNVAGILFDTVEFADNTSVSNEPVAFLRRNVSFTDEDHRLRHLPAVAEGHSVHLRVHLERR